ncbi:MAG: ATP-binding protein [Rhodoferax sp.]|uniref:ATP-binding protein n=1 Tax=Rhodoferax sp. TaxID=50421 RepID=UPI001B3ED85C|nr:ATP-binding protein [Rhodoferax sp.]MBP8285827.1 ATP-binding protein [Rhodoferax sp.]MBP9734096.1 ATP-binding protein [Rhodoferax sp.]
MKAPGSIRLRLLLGAALVLLAFLAAAGWAVRQAYSDSLLAQRYSRLQTTVYLLMAGAELDAQGGLQMPTTLAEPRLALPDSGLIASISTLDDGLVWQSASALGHTLPASAPLSVGNWQFENSTLADGAYLSARYAVKWSASENQTTLVFNVLENKTGFDRELQTFEGTLWRWLGGSAILLLLAQTLLLRWGLMPLTRMAQEVEQIEHGQQDRLEGHYPQELAGLCNNLNGLIDQERARQTRYRDALDDLAHSLKTPLAALQASLDEPAALPERVAQQVNRMNDIVVHQLGRASASGAARFAPPLTLLPIVQRIRDTLAKVHADKSLVWTLEIDPALSWRMDEGDAFEMLGNLMDNAAKWANTQVLVDISLQSGSLQLSVSDDGPGFAAKKTEPQRRLRLDEQVPGHGIGLAVVKDLVASYQGQLTITRSGLGGAQLKVMLPRG